MLPDLITRFRVNYFILMKMYRQDFLIFANTTTGIFDFCQYLDWIFLIWLSNLRPLLWFPRRIDFFAKYYFRLVCDYDFKPLDANTAIKLASVDLFSRVL